jgi:hypothetical protein
MFFPYFERLIKWVTINTCCRKDRHLNHLIQKNIEAHRKRNQKTSIMLALSLSFAIFSSSVFMMMNNLIQSEIKAVAGADLYANCIGTNSFLD